MKKVRIAMVQMLVGSSKQSNLKKASEMVTRAAREEKADIVILPVSRCFIYQECFNSPYGIEFFKDYAEDTNHVHYSF